MATAATDRSESVDRRRIEKIVNKREHWNNVYTNKRRDEVSWFREHLDTSLEMILNAVVTKDALIIDVGGGNSTLVDDLIDKGFVHLTVLDISKAAIDSSRERLGARSSEVDWIIADITEAVLPDAKFDVWHDRAVFHFLTDAGDRRKYVETVRSSLKPDGHVIIAAFSLDGPLKCSGLDVVRYNPESMLHEFGEEFRLIESIGENHETPFGTTQDFVYCHLRRA